MTLRLKTADENQSLQTLSVPREFLRPYVELRTDEADVYRADGCSVLETENSYTHYNSQF
jgi:hypothetical protein